MVNTLFSFTEDFSTITYSPVGYSKPTSMKLNASSKLWAIRVLNWSLAIFEKAVLDVYSLLE